MSDEEREARRKNMDRVISGFQKSLAESAEREIEFSEEMDDLSDQVTGLKSEISDLKGLLKKALEELKKESL